VLALSISEEKEKKKLGPRRGKPAAQPQGGMWSIGEANNVVFIYLFIYLFI
jgi:hypothetical protein